MIQTGWVYAMGALGLAAIPVLVWVLRRIQEERQKERAGLWNLGALSDAQFDDYIVKLFEGLGYTVATVGSQESMGVDWILTDPRGARTAVQTRRWRQDVGPEAIEQVVGGAVFHRCDDRLVVTTATFTSEARRLGRQTETRLWTLTELAGAMDSIRTGALTAPLRPHPSGTQPLTALDTTKSAPPAEQAAAASQPEVGVMKCPRCGKSMVKRSVNGRPVLVCQDFPRCTGARVQDGR